MSRNLKPSPLPLLALLLCGSLGQFPGMAPAQERTTTYTWVDEQGTRHYSDRPPPQSADDARTVELQVRSPQRPRSPTDPRGLRDDLFQDGDGDDDTAAAPEPVSISVRRPQPDETYVNTGGRVQVTVDVQPSLPQGGRVVVYVDGAQIATGGPGQQTFVLSPVYRGTHTLSATVQDSDGRLLASSSNVTFYVRQASAINPP